LTTYIIIRKDGRIVSVRVCYTQEQYEFYYPYEKGRRDALGGEIEVTQSTAWMAELREVK